MAFTLFVTICFLCAAAFVYVLQNYGLIQACFAGAVLFLAGTLITAVCYMARKNQVRTRAREHARENAKSPVHAALSDPMLVATGIQLIRAVGIKRLVPILAVGGLALGILASRGNSTAKEPPEA